MIGSQRHSGYHLSAVVQSWPWDMLIESYDILTQWGLVMPFGDIDLGQHWLRQWLVAWWHQVITWTNVDWSSVKSNDIHVRAISHEMPQPENTKICLKIASLKFHWNLPVANELINSTTASHLNQSYLSHTACYQYLIRVTVYELYPIHIYKAYGTGTLMDQWYQ